MIENVKVENLYVQAMKEFIGERYESSIELLSEALSLEPEFALGFVSRGAAFLQCGMFQNAVVDFDRAIAANPEYPKAYHLRGLAYERLGDHGAAVKDFDRAIELDPDYGAAYFSRANLRALLGEYEQAQEDIEMATQLTGRNIEAFANENNVWRSHHLKVEDAIETEMLR